MPQNIEFITIPDLKPPDYVRSLIPEETARHNALVPLWIEEGQLVIAMADPGDSRAIEALEKETNYPVKPFLATYFDIQQAIEKCYQGEPKKAADERASIVLSRCDLGEEHKRKLSSWFSGEIALSELYADLTLQDQLAVLEAMAWYVGLPYLNLDTVTTQPGIAALIPVEMAKEGDCLPLWLVDTTLYIAIRSPGTRENLTCFCRNTALRIQEVLTTPKQWRQTFNKIYFRGQKNASDYKADTLQYLQRQNKISATDVDGVEVIHRRTGKPFDRILIDQGMISAEEWLEATAEVSGIPIADRGESRAAAAAHLPEPLARTCGVIPLEAAGDELVVAMAAPDQEMVKFLQTYTGLEIDPRLMNAAKLEALQDRHDGTQAASARFKGPRLGSLLISMGKITRSQLEEVLASRPDLAMRLGEKLVGLSYLDEKDIAEALSLQTGIPLIRANGIKFDQRLANAHLQDFVIDHRVVPLAEAEQEAWVASSDPFSSSFRLLESKLGKGTVPLLASRATIESAIEEHYGLRLHCKESRQVVEELISRGIIDRETGRSALDRYTYKNEPLEQTLQDLSGLTEREVYTIIAEVLDLPLNDLQVREESSEVIGPLGDLIERTSKADAVDDTVAKQIDIETSLRLEALPIEQSDGETVVAFADHNYKCSLAPLEDLLGQAVKPVLTPRSVLVEAVHRHLGRQMLGTYLLQKEIITRGQLNDALDLARRTGVQIGHALINRGYINQVQLYEALAEQLDMPFGNLDPSNLEQETVQMIDPQVARSYGILPLYATQSVLYLAMTNPQDPQAEQIARAASGKKIKPILITEQNLELALEYWYQSDYVARSTSELLERKPQDSAYYTLSTGQKIAFVLFGLISLLLIILIPLPYLIFLNILSSIFYLAFSYYKFALINRGLSRDIEIAVTEEEIAALDESDLPVYTLLVPVYREAEVIAELIDALSKLNYPSTKLDIKLLIEADDDETIQKVDQLDLPAQIQPIIVPHAQPKTKPKACNYGLIHARGDYVVIYDAEDAPEPNQLKHVIVAYDKASPEVVCIQAKLNYYNRHQNILTAWFTTEYSMWFDLLLPGLDSQRVPIPLGGTSNHFKRDALVEVGAWDPYNVTEDADLGVRLFKAGYRTATIDSTTYEEANSELRNWIRQRSRWIKGYIQTWLVHMRHPVRLLKDIGLKPFLSFQLIVGGTFFAAILNPVYWALTTIWFLFQPEFIHSLYPGLIFHVGAITFYLGNFAFTYMNVAGTLSRHYYQLVKHAMFSPLYWGLMSVGAWKGMWQLVTKPHYWEKTRHGLFKGQPKIGEDSVSSPKQK